MTAFWIVCFLQCLGVLVLYFGDIGFDKAGRFGLDFDHFLALMLLQICLFIAAAILIVRSRRWSYFGVQLPLLVLTAAGILAN